MIKETTNNGLATEELTGFLTRKSFDKCIQLLNQQADTHKVTLIVIELIRFGVVNNSIGNGLGDRVIKTVAKRLTKMFPNVQGIARLHGDHFGLLFNDDIDEALEVDRLLDFVQRPLALRGEVIVLGIRIGVAHSHLLANADAELLHAAEVALHYAKQKNSQVTYFDCSMIDNAISTHRLENDLRVSLVTNASELHQAIVNQEFELRYQPIVSAISGDVFGFEALLRWNHPIRGPVSPALFISMAEQINVMSVLGSWVIKRACADAMTWGKNAQGKYPGVSINVSPTQFLEPDILLTTLTNAMQDSAISPDRVKIEITESVEFSPLMGSHLSKIKQLGCQLSLDDFGTGYSSIAQLVDLPLDYVKVDQSLVWDLTSSDKEVYDKSVKVVKSILSLANSLELTPIIEGIENESGIKAVRLLGGDLVQGYVYSKPLKVAEVNHFITCSNNNQ